MCGYCMIADFNFRHDPPWSPIDPVVPWPSQVPNPIPGSPIVPWGVDRLEKFECLLRRVKELEDRLGCPCEPNKADYLDLLKRRIEDLEKKITPGVHLPLGGSGGSAHH